MTTRSLLRIGTRGSPLALAQAEEVRDRLSTAHDALRDPDAITIEIIRTTGDRITDRPLADIGGKGLFTKEIEQALLDGRIDMAVHSVKDVPTVLPPGLDLVAFLPREDPRDAFFSRDGLGLLTLPSGAVVGTSSPRRQAAILMRRPDLKVTSIRGNVSTRLEKLRVGDVDGTLLAVAGLIRLGMANLITDFLSTDVMLPAVGQGAIGLQIRAGDDTTLDWLRPINCAETASRVTAERAMLDVLEGSCRTPIAGMAERTGDMLALRGLVMSPDGSHHVAARQSGSTSDADALGRIVGRELLDGLPPGYQLT